MMKSIALAFSFLTILPSPKHLTRDTSPRDLAASLSFFPVVGSVLGLLCLGAAYFLSALVPAPILSVLLTLFLAILTRFFHLDGLADLADGLWGGFTIERRLEIMKDSRTGSFGAAALCLVLLLKSASFFSLLTLQAWPAILMAPTLARYAQVVAAYGSIYARKEGGLGKSFLEHMKTSDLLTATAIAAAVSVVASISYAAPLLIAAVVCALAFKRMAHAMLGGITGDVLGAINEITETVLLALAATLATHLT